MSSVYEKLAKSGWLGTKAQVSEEYGHPDWKSETQEDPMAKALKKRMEKQASLPDESEASGS